MSDRGAELRAAVWADPDNVDALRVYADWLCEQDNSLGTYLQHALIAEPTTAQTKAAAAILKRDRAKWLGPARPCLTWWSNDRLGFVDTITATARYVKAGYPYFVALGPRVRLQINGMQKRLRGNVREISQLALGRFRALSIATLLTDREIAELAPAFAGIEELDLSYNSFTGAGLRSVGAHVAGIKALRVVSHNYMHDWVDAIVETPGFQSLERLSLFGHGYNAFHVDVGQIVDGPTRAMVERLRAMPAMKSVNEGA